MKKLIASLVVLGVVGSGQALASTLADGFNWPEGSSATSHAVQLVQAEKISGFNWPEGRTFESDVTATSHSNVAQGFNWPEGN